jgi:hypothetical protein
MGIYSNTRYDNLGDYNVDVAANESYNCVTGCAMALIEGYQNDFALFESAIHSDMAEIAAVNEGYEVINEGAKEIWSKLKEIFTKLLAKIKGIFKSFIAKISGVFADSAALHKKYGPVISKNSNWKNFKAKVRPFKGSGADVVGYINDKGTYKYRDCYWFNQTTGGKVGDINVSDIVKKDSDIDQDDIYSAVVSASLSDDLKNAINGGDINDIGKEFMDIVFDDEEVKDDWSSGEILHSYIGDLLKDATKNEEKIKKCNANMESTIEKIIKQINKEAENVSKALSNNRLNGKTGTKSPDEYKPHKTVVGGGKESDKFKGSASTVRDTATSAGTTAKTADSIEIVERLAGFWQRYANAEQAVINKLTAARLGAYKFAITQARRVFSSAAAYASVDHKNESYDYYTAIGEAVEYDTLSDLQAIC